MVSMSTRAAGSSSVMRRVASMPSIVGMRTSITTTSGCSRSNPRTASAPSMASPTTSMSGSASRIMRKPPRISAWSSAISTPIGRGAGALTTPTPPRGEAALAPRTRRRAWRRSRASRRRGRRVPAYRCRPCPSPVAPAASAASVVGHLDHEGVVAPVEQHPRMRAAGVLHDVGERFLHDAVGDEVGARRQRTRLPACHGLDGHPGATHGLQQSFELCEPGLRRQVGLGAWVGEDADQPAHLDQAIAARLLDAGDGGLRRLWVTVDHRAGRPGLHDHDAHRMGDRVVEFPGDAGALGHHGVVCRPFAIAGEAAAAVVGDTAEQHRQARRERGADQHFDPVRIRVREQEARHRSHDRDGHDRTLEPLPVDVRRSRERGDHEREREIGTGLPGGERRGGGADEGQHGDRSAPPERERGAAEHEQRVGIGPRRRSRGAARTVPEHRAEHREHEDERGEQRIPDQRVDPAQSVPARRRVHAPTVARRRP